MPLAGLKRCLAVIAWLIAGGVSAQPADATRGIEQLRQHMNPRITEKPPAVGQAPAVEAPKASGWTRMAVGMEEAQVAELLGAPDRTERRAQTIRWFWAKGADQGWVDFAADTRKVLEWRSH